jgi:NAD(P)H-flavin reductase
VTTRTTRSRAPTEALRPEPFVVTATRRATADTVTLELHPADGPGIRYRPGQFTMVYAFGVGEVPLSVSGGTGGVLHHTVRAVGPVTGALCRLEVGDVIGVRGPFGRGWPLQEALGRDVLIVAGGIGLAPLRPVVEQLVERRDLYGTLDIVYGARTPDDLLFIDDLHRWRSRFDMSVEVTVDRGEQHWRGDVGVVTPLIERTMFDADNVVAMVCGPEVMMRVVARTLLGRGVDPSQIAVSLERNMKCGVGFCGHCQYGPDFVCKTGPVVCYSTVADRMGVAEL